MSARTVREFAKANGFEVVGCLRYIGVQETHEFYVRQWMDDGENLYEKIWKKSDGNQEFQGFLIYTQDDRLIG